MYDLRPDQDATMVLENPGKGLYHHYYDNGTRAYPSSREQIEAIPGCRQLYVRLPWSEFEPERGRFDWRRIDELVRDWVPRGFTLSFRFTCKETGRVYATPEWVKRAGAAGGFYKAAPSWGVNAWEPKWDDEVFLRHLGAFLREAGRRYDGKPWLDFVDIGSIGDWGEGHTHFGSRTRVPVATRRTHIDLNSAAFVKTPLAILDGFCDYQTPAAEAKALFEYARSVGCWLRDDSIGVEWYLNQGAKDTWSVDETEWFAATWPEAPTVIELQHYGMMKKAGDWRGADGCERGADWLMKAMDLCRPTWLGYHGWAAEWLEDNPRLTRELANRVGYWLFPEESELADRARPGAVVRVRLRVSNRGWAPPYRPWTVALRLARGATAQEIPVTGMDARSCAPDRSVDLFGRASVPARITPGRYSVSLRFTDGKRAVRLACTPERQDGDGWLRLGAFSAR